MYNNLHSSDGTIKQIFVNNPFAMEILTSSIIIYLYDVIIGTEIDEEPQTVQLVIKLFEYLLYIIDINSITDENIMTIIKKYRADENLSRLKRFNKKSDELQNTHKIKRKFNLGYLDDEDPEEEFNEIDFMTQKVNQKKVNKLIQMKILMIWTCLMKLHGMTMMQG